MGRGQQGEAIEAILYGVNKRNPQQQSVIEEMKTDSRYLGFGYLLQRTNMEDPVSVDQAVLASSEQLHFDYDLLFEWVNSKEGRWYGEDSGMFREGASFQRNVKEALESMNKMLQAIAERDWSGAEYDEQLAKKYAQLLPPGE